MVTSKLQSILFVDKKNYDMKLTSSVVIIFLIPLILSIGLAPVLPFVDAQKKPQCTGDQVLVKIHSDNTFHCVSQQTASVWDKYGT